MRKGSSKAGSLGYFAPHTSGKSTRHGWGRPEESLTDHDQSRFIYRTYYHRSPLSHTAAAAVNVAVKTGGLQENKAEKSIGAHIAMTELWHVLPDHCCT